MPLLSEAIKAIEEVAPPALAEGWDNSGLQVGGLSSEVTRVLVALDPLPEVVKEAAGMGAELVVSHHPLFFSDIRSLDTSSGPGAAAAAAIKAGIAIYSAHTSLDSANPGVSDALASILGLFDVRPIEPAPGGPEGCGLGRVGLLPKPMTVRDALAMVKAALAADGARLAGDPGKTVRIVAVCGGSGASLMEKAASLGAELYITGDVKYHDALRARELGLAVMDAGHFNTERFFMPALAEMLAVAFGKKGWDIDVKVSGAQSEPWLYM